MSEQPELPFEEDEEIDFSTGGEFVDIPGEDEEVTP